MPNWLNDAVFYEIYPQSFCDTNGDGIGDIEGIIVALNCYVGNLFVLHTQDLTIMCEKTAKFYSINIYLQKCFVHHNM